MFIRSIHHVNSIYTTENEAKPNSQKATMLEVMKEKFWKAQAQSGVSNETCILNAHTQ